MQVISRHGNGAECFACNIFKRGVEAIEEEFPGLATVDPKVKDTVAKQRPLAALLSTEEDIADLPPVKRLGVQLQRGLLNGAIDASKVVSSGANDFLRWFAEVFSTDDMMYVGAPVNVDGHTMGSLCAFYTGMGRDTEPDEAVKARHSRAADRVADVLMTLESSPQPIRASMRGRSS